MTVVNSTTATLHEPRAAREVPKDGPLRKKPGCGRKSIVGTTIENESGFFAGKLFCKGYRCACCSRRKFRQVRTRIGELAIPREMNKFLTLTLDPKKLHLDGQTREEITETTIAYIKYLWRSFRVYLSRFIQRNAPQYYWRWMHLKQVALASGEKPEPLIPFFLTLELHKSGIAHLHVLLGLKKLYIPEKWIRKAWSGLGGGIMCKISKVIDVHSIPAYLAKYVTKDRLADIPEGVRRFQLSNGMVLWPKKEKPGYYVSEESIEELAARHENAVLSYDVRGGVRMLVSFHCRDPINAATEILRNWTDGADSDRIGEFIEERPWLIKWRSA